MSPSILKESLSDQQQRCRCGKLLAVLSLEGVEIKCRHCKRFVKISIEQIVDFLKGKEPESSDPSWHLASQNDACPCHILRKEEKK